MHEYNPTVLIYNGYASFRASFVDIFPDSVNTTEKVGIYPPVEPLKNPDIVYMLGKCQIDQTTI